MVAFFFLKNEELTDAKMHSYWIYFIYYDFRFTGYKNALIFKTRNKCFAKRFLTACKPRLSNSTLKLAYCDDLLSNVW